MSKSGILDALRSEEHSLKSQLVAGAFPISRSSV